MTRGAGGPGSAAPDDLADHENWQGGFYELAILLGFADDGRVDTAARAIWSSLGIEGPIVSHDSTGEDSHSFASALKAGHQRGIAQLPGGVRVVCGLLLIREEDTRDWLDFYIPLGALSRADSRVGVFPVGGQTDGSLEWRRDIDAWLVGIGERTYATVRFDYALIGWEVSGEDVPGDDVIDRWVGVLRPANGRLVHVPANRG